jgi:hypothetical protein
MVNLSGVHETLCVFSFHYFFLLICLVYVGK